MILPSIIKCTPWILNSYYDAGYSAEHGDNQEDDDEKYLDLSWSLIHGMYPSDHDDLQDVSVKLISLKSCNCKLTS